MLDSYLGHMHCLPCLLKVATNAVEPRCPLCRRHFRTPGGLIHINPVFGRNAYRLELFQNLLPRSVIIHALSSPLTAEPRPRIVEEHNEEREAVRRTQEDITRTNEQLAMQVEAQQEEIQAYSEALQKTRRHIYWLNARAASLRRRIEKELAYMAS